MISESGKDFVESLRRRIEEHNLKKNADYALLDQSLMIILDNLKSHEEFTIGGIKNYKTESFSSFIDFKSSDFDSFLDQMKEFLKEIDPKYKGIDLDDLKVFRVNMIGLEKISGKKNNALIIELYRKNSSVVRMRIIWPKNMAHCGRIHRKNRKWVTWFWDGDLKKIILDRIDPFLENIEFLGTLDGEEFRIMTELDQSGFNYEILSFEKL